MLQLNGHDRFRKREGSYFAHVQPYEYHSGENVQRAGDATNGVQGSPLGGIYCYSFALKPEEHQPSGTCNFSRIDNAEIVFENVSATGTLYLYVINYNVLRIISGMGGVAFSN